MASKAIFVIFRESVGTERYLGELYEETLLKIVAYNIISSPGFDAMKYHCIEKKALEIKSLLFPHLEARIKNPNLHLDLLLEENSKKSEPDDFFVITYGQKEVDGEIWRQVSQFPKNATMLHETEKGFVKVTGIKNGCFKGRKIVFPKE